ncbi:efflux transporter outer membrane subunit [Xanthomonas sp. NCPPB 2654]|uniref:efflux transporter outer membrane subunit n=1 Tax=unclassified Xanthomonas TaxID=2643310 RepID=UPI0021E0A783|nr:MULTISPECIES: efflux transporter outer membrane subunit [unclassified Xanthomonas]MDL5365423.1 efflux transporter outer membrane subunit [Xanthomonas sp. NCPPB 2654]UYC20130.1 efflux transporter outer membrane subunit [Xanthomonas sp. CFBP 8443]
MHPRSTFHTRRSAVASLAVALLLAGCSLAPAYQRPPAPVPEQWSDGTAAHETNESTPPAVNLDWQEFVVDPTLRDLVALALANNRDLRQTLLNVEAARAEYRIQRADRLPTLQLDASGVRQRALGTPEVERSYEVGLGLAAFELDLFGRVRNLSAAALQDYLATERDAHSARVSLVAEVVQAYLVRDGAQHRYRIGTDILAAREASLQLTAQLRDLGFANELDHQEAIGLVEQVKVDLERIDREFRQATNALTLLLGVADAGQRLPTLPAAGATLVQKIAPGTPSALLMRRPDIRAAEHRLKARNASIGAARAAFFPRIALTGTSGRGSTALSDLFGSSGQRLWSFTPQLTLPIFDAGRNRGDLDLAHVRKDVAVAAYEHAIQVAFQEVSDALAATDTLAREETAQRAVAQATAEALRLSEARYRSGVDDHLRLLDAQRSDFASQMALVDVQTQRQIALSTLFRALGGGWRGELSAPASLPAP